MSLALGRNMSLKPKHLQADRSNVRTKNFLNAFHLYLWRSLESPGIRYLAGSVSTAESMSRELLKEGYIVKVIHAATDTEYELRGGALLPVRTSPVPA
jgi:hypothetical protein